MLDFYMLLEKYSPKSVSGVVGNTRGAYEMLSFVKSWKKEIAIITGPPGCGKSLALELVSEELKCEFVEGNVEEVQRASKEQSLLNRNKILAIDIDEPDHSFKGHKQYLEELKNLSEKTRWPLFLVTNDIYQDSLWRLRKAFASAKIIRFFPPFENYIVEFLEHVCKSEKIPYEREALRAIAKKSEGDVRFALLALESMPHAASYYADTLTRDGMQNSFTVLDSVFAGSGVPPGQEMQNLLHVVAENIPEVYGQGQIEYAYRCLALAEWLGEKTRWHMDVLTALPKAPAGRKKYSFPKRQREEISKDVANALHCSSKKAVAYKRVLERLGIV